MRTVRNMAVCCKRVRKPIAVQTADSFLACHSNVQGFDITLHELKVTYKWADKLHMRCSVILLLTCASCICHTPPVCISLHQMNFCFFPFLSETGVTSSNVFRNLLERGLPTFLRPRATPDIVGWFAGRTWKNNSKWYT
jgi:hypothetical protein